MELLIAHLKEEGILTPDDTVNTDKLNLISGMHTPDFVETLWVFAAGDSGTITRIHNIMSRLYADDRQSELYELVTVLHGLLGLEVPRLIAQLSAHPDVLNHYLFEFLLDCDDVISSIAASES